MIENAYQIQVRQQHLKHDYTKFQVEFYYMDHRELFVTCTEMCVTLDINENHFILKRIIQVYLLKVACKIVYSVKSYD